MTGRGQLRPLLAATAASGAAALMYETLWTRSLAIALGSTVQAAAAVVRRVPGAGSRWRGPVRDDNRPHRRVIVIYAAIEIAIAWRQWARVPAVLRA